MPRFTSTSSYDTSIQYQIKKIGLCAKCNQPMTIGYNKPKKGMNGNMTMLYGKGCDDSRCGGCAIDLDTEYYNCSVCKLDFCKLHSENPSYKGPTSDEKENTRTSYEKKHDQVYMKETLAILMKRAATEPDIREVLNYKIQDKPLTIP